MGAVIGIPTTRVSDLYVRQRLTRQTKADQLALFQTQTQLATGYRIQMPSEDADAARRIISLQRLLERKDQVQTNLATNNSYMSATDTALSTVAGHVAEIRAVALGVIGTMATEEQREAAAQQVQQMIMQLRDIGNHKFRGRYLFAGGDTTTRPFELSDNGLIQYSGDEQRMSSYADIDLLFDTNLHGDEVFGAVSAPVRGSSDLNPILTFDTRLADLRSGRGITMGSFSITAGNQTQVIDMTAAETIGDVAAMIHAQSPSTATLNVEVTATGLAIDSDPPGTLITIREVGGGTTADELGILTPTTTIGPILGEDLDPIVRKTTRLDDIMGVRSRAISRLNGVDNDLTFEGITPGAEHDGIQIVLTDDGTVATPGVDESASYDETTRTLTVSIASGSSRASDVVRAVNALSNIGDSPVVASVERIDEENDGQGLISIGSPSETIGTLTGGSGIRFDKDSGLHIVNGDIPHVVRFDDAETVEDFLNMLNMSDIGVVAEINEDSTGINIRSAISGGDFMIGENGGSTAAELGLRTFTRDTKLTDLNFGRGVVDFTSAGVAASATYESVGDNNDLVFTAKNPGINWNEYNISFVDSGLGPGQEKVAFDSKARTIEFTIDAGTTTANDIIRVFGEHPNAGDEFRVELVEGDGMPNSGSGYVAVGSLVAGGGDNGGNDFTITRRDGVVIDIDIAGAETVGDVLDIINHQPANLASGIPLVARLAEYGNGIELVDDNPGTEILTVERTQLSLAAINLGLIPEGEDRVTATDLGTVGNVLASSASSNSNIIFQTLRSHTAPNGTEILFEDTGLGPGSESLEYSPELGILRFGIDPGTTTANDIIALLHADPDASDVFTAVLEPSDGGPNTGNGIVDVGTATLVGGTPELLTASDVNPLDNEGLFTALLRLRQGLEDNDVLTTQRAIDILDAQMVELHFSRAELGARQQGIDIMKNRLENEEIDLNSELSKEYDVDMVDAISQFTGRQIAYDASLKSTAQIFQMSLLNYL